MNLPIIVAEISANHLGDFERAKKLAIAACKAGADAVKFQFYKPEHMAGRMKRGGDLTGTIWEGQDLMALYAKAQTPIEWAPRLFEIVRSHGCKPFASVFDPEYVERLDPLDPWAYKIASLELNYKRLWKAIEATSRPIIASVGAATQREIQMACDRCHQYLTLLHCIAAYPTEPRLCNLARLRTLDEFGRPIGWSDHTLSLVVPVAATALGAVMIEKHLTLRRADGGPDAAFSLEPHEFARMVEMCREAASAIGSPEIRVLPVERPMRKLRRVG